MRRKRLKHQADILCHMFRGWQLLSDYRTLTDLGSGTLQIDFLNGACRHNGKPIPTLSIVQAVSSWWRNDLAANKIPLDDIQEARLDVGLDLSKQEGQRDHSITWAKSAKVFISCSIRARSIIRTNEATYASEYADRLEWPRTWAA
jgi:hypothetical protein